MPHIIGLGHYSRVGKDTFGDMLIEQFRQSGLMAKKLSFAWKLKEVAHQLYGWSGLREPEFYETVEGAMFRDVPLPTIGKTPVECWIGVGNGIRSFYPDTWCEYVLQSFDKKANVIIVPDVRFHNEVAAIQRAGGMLLKIVRPGKIPRNTEADLTLYNWRGWDAAFGHTGELADLRRAAEEVSLCIRNDWDIHIAPTQECYDLEASMKHLIDPEALEKWACQTTA